MFIAKFPRFRMTQRNSIRRASIYNVCCHVGCRNHIYVNYLLISSTITPDK
jgi:hypothetical protein